LAKLLDIEVRRSAAYRQTGADSASGYIEGAITRLTPRKNLYSRNDQHSTTVTGQVGACRLDTNFFRHSVGAELFIGFCTEQGGGFAIRPGPRDKDVRSQPIIPR